MGSSPAQFWSSMLIGTTETARSCYILNASTWVARFRLLARVLIGKLEMLIPRNLVPIIVTANRYKKWIE
jgi:hypothetical protein